MSDATSLRYAHIVQYTQERALRGASVVRHRKQLISAIIYATTPNLLLFPSVFVNACNIILSTIPNELKTSDNTVVQVGRICNAVNRYVSYVRLPVITASTFAAFTAYRHQLSLVPLLGFKKVFFTVKSTSALSQPTASNNVR
uniref:G_PROTEIN_RECEP_F1_2 domain-containing protein n=1 Tax=Steinernema glaseri TaxID=37863 RepID=A0A1I7YP23_9BILA